MLGGRLNEVWLPWEKRRWPLIVIGYVRAEGSRGNLKARGKREERHVMRLKSCSRGRFPADELGLGLEERRSNAASTKANVRSKAVPAGS
jgi:hypothetical protein